MACLGSRQGAIWPSQRMGLPLPLLCRQRISHPDNPGLHLALRPSHYVIGPDDIIAYADINVDYRSEPELSAVLLVLQRLQYAILQRTSPMKREIIRVELLSTYLENWKAADIGCDPL